MSANAEVNIIVLHSTNNNHDVCRSFSVAVEAIKTISSQKKIVNELVWPLEQLRRDNY